jgi:hypothetical protein
VAILQSNYLPWKGYFAIMDRVDEFVLYDGFQYTTDDWRNRNLIKTRRGREWLTVPVRARGHLARRIDEILVDGDWWRRKHWRTLCHHYRGAPHFRAYRDGLEAFYLGGTERRLSRINEDLLRLVAGFLAIRTPITVLPLPERRQDRTDRIIALCHRLGARAHLFGPAARAYLDVARFRGSGLEDRWMDYAGYAEYRQPFPPFEHRVTVLDLLFHEGPRARAFLHPGAPAVAAPAGPPAGGAP